MMTDEMIEQFAFMVAKLVHEFIDLNESKEEPKFELLEDNMCLPLIVMKFKFQDKYNYNRIKEKTNEMLRR